MTAVRRDVMPSSHDGERTDGGRADRHGEGARAAAFSRPGCKRRRNEDAHAVLPEAGLFLVADGMGGHPDGDRASRRTVEELQVILPRELRSTPARDQARILKTMGQAIGDFNERLSKLHPDGGTTLVAAYRRGTRLFLAHLGDTRAYRYRQGQLRRLTRDHTVVQNLVEAGLVDDLGAARHPDRGALTRYLGLGARAEPSLRCVRLRPGDRILLCTDGVHTVLPTPALERVLGAVTTASGACRALVDLVASRSGRDDATALVLDAAPPRIPQTC